MDASDIRTPEIRLHPHYSRFQCVGSKRMERVKHLNYAITACRQLYHEWFEICLGFRLAVAFPLGLLASHIII